MERRDRSVIVTIRIPEGLERRIEADVEENGDHSSRADWIIAALRAYETERTALLAKRKILTQDMPNPSSLSGPDLNIQ